MAASFLRDTLRSLRSWRRTPGSALLVVLALGLSGGALIALVSLFNALFLRELPVPHPEELVGVSTINPRSPAWGAIPASMLSSLDGPESVFQDFSGFERLDSTAVVANTSQHLAIEGVSGRYFETLGLRPELGQLVGVRDVDAAAHVATISFRFWQTRFGADRDAIGRTFRVQGQAVTVIGVAPRVFTGLEVGMPTDVWMPASMVSRLRGEPASLMFFEALVGRLRPGVTLQQARAQLESRWPAARDASAAAVAALVPQARDEMFALQPHVESAASGFSAAGYRVDYQRPLTLLLLLGAITLVLSCANLSGLLLARWSAREGNLAVQAALGASTGRLVSQVLGESLALSTVAVVLSGPLALWSAKGLTLLVWNQPDVLPLDLSPDYRVVGLMVGLACFVAACVSLLPASRIWSAKLALVRGTRGLPGRSVTRWGRWLVAAQVGLSVPLLVTAWTVAANLHRLEAVNTGFRTDGVVVASLTNQSGIAPATDPVAYLTRLASALRADPGIVSAALMWNEPMSFSADWRRRPVAAADGSHGVRTFVVPVSPGYFETLGIPIAAGRDFRWTDDGRQRDAAIISAEIAKAVFPDGNPVGRRVRLDGQPDRLVEVIGVVADANLAEPHATNQMILFTALLQQPTSALASRSPLVLLRSSLPPRSVETLARHTIAALGRDDIVEVHTVEHTVNAALLRERVTRLGAEYFAGLTTLLVFVGLYAVLNLGVMRRIPEIGLRMALGASAHDIRMTVIREAFSTASAGLVLGVPLAFISGGLVASSLTLVGAHNALAFGAAIALILAISVLSVLVPLRRAGRITPVEALGSR